MGLVLSDLAGPAGASSSLAALAAAIENVRLRAAQEGAREIVATALGMLEAIAADDNSGNGLEALSTGLQEGITKLQQSFDRDEPPAQSLAQDPELLADFILESREHLAGIETLALTLERDPHDAEALHSTFRSFHTIKGLAGFLELWEVQKLAHEVETVLDRARNGELVITPPAIDVVLQSADYLLRWLLHLETGLNGGASEPPRRDEELLGRLRSVTEAPDPAPVETAGESASPATQQSPQPAASADPSKEAKPRNEASTVKVDTGKLDYLVDMAGEMVIAQSLVQHDPELGTVRNPRLQRNLAQLAHITAELQKTAMSMRLVPVGPMFRRMARLVRDLSRQFQKSVEMETEGDNIDLDRTIVEELADPLMHMVRNALDHGIESPDEREARGKNRTARLCLRARHQAGQVVIEIADDGRGLDREKIAAKAVQKGLITGAEKLSDSEVFGLIFAPGFSTAAEVTNVSGRGVGMDVVRRHIEKLRGRIEIRSTPGQGATFILKLPLTLAIINGLVVGVGKERYIVPLFTVREMLRPTADVIWTVQQRAEMALVRGTLLPVVRLHRCFGVTPRSEDPLQSVLIVAEVEGRRSCVLVDELIGKQEVVIKGLGETFKNISGVAGGAILGDGRVGLILDLDRLFKDQCGDSGH